MSDSVSQIKERLSIVDIVSSYIKVISAGKNYKANCPFHNERTPSFFISPDRGSYYCFGCGAKGDIFTFVEEFEGLDFKGALKVLADRAGVTLSSYKGKIDKEEKDVLYEIMEVTTRFLEDKLDSSSVAKDYLKERGVNDESIKNFRIGFAPNAWTDLYSYLEKRGFQDKDIEAVGLIKQSSVSGQSRYYDRFRNRIMFPIFDTSGRVIAFSGRTLETGNDVAKYINSPDTPLFKKANIFFGLYQAKDSIRKNNFSILVEGQFDVVMLHQIGFRNTIAVSGTALTETLKTSTNETNHLGVLRRLSKNIILCFDSDSAGMNALFKAAKTALSLQMDAKVINLDGKKDPADYVFERGKEAWSENVKNAKHVIIFFADYLTTTIPDNRQRLKKVLTVIVPLIYRVESETEKDYFVGVVGEICGINKESLKKDLGNYKDDKNEVKETEIIKKETNLKIVDDNKQLEKNLAGVIISLKTKNSNLAEEIILSLKDELPEFSLDEIVNNNQDLLFESERIYEQESSDNLVSVAKSIKSLLIKRSLEKNIGILTSDLKIAEEENNKSLSVEISKKIQDFISKLRRL